MTTRENSSPTTTMSEKLTRYTYLSSSLDKIYGSQWRDQSKMQRAYFYSKYQKVIDLMDIFEIWTLNMLHSICLDYLKSESPSRNTLSVICKYLTIDQLLTLKIVPTGPLKPASVYYLCCIDQKVIDLFCKEYTEHDKAFQKRKKKMTPEEQGEYWKKQQMQSVELKERKRLIKWIHEFRTNKELILRNYDNLVEKLGEQDLKNILEDLKIELD